MMTALLVAACVLGYVISGFIVGLCCFLWDMHRVRSWNYSKEGRFRFAKQFIPFHIFVGIFWWIFIPCILLMILLNAVCMAIALLIGRPLKRLIMKYTKD